MKKRADAKTFVSAWQTSDNLDVVAKKLGISRLSARTRAAKYRRNGVKLNKFADGRGGPKLDFVALAKLAGSFARTKQQPVAKRSVKKSRKK